MVWKSGYGLLGVLLRVPSDRNRGVTKGSIPSEAWVLLPISLVVGRIKFLAFVEVRSQLLDGCWSETFSVPRGHSQAVATQPPLKAVYSVVVFFFKARRRNLSHFESL